MTKKRGSRDAGTAPGRKHLVDKEKNSRNRREKVLDEEREREKEREEKSTLTVSRVAQIPLASGRCKKKTDFREGSKKT